jgi:hypothetical protein
MKTPREHLFDAIQSTAASDDDLEGNVLVGFLVVAEWRGGKGEQWLSKISGDHSAPLPTWRQRGYAAEVVHDMWVDVSMDDSRDVDE